LTAYSSKIEIFQEIFNLAKKSNNKGGKKFLLATDNFRRKNFHSAATFEKIDRIQSVFNLANEHLTTEDKKRVISHI